jgi:cytochrome c553
MRSVGVAALLLLTACAGTGAGRAPEPEPMGSLAQIMRGIYFPNSNILFDVQSVDPDAPPPPSATGGGATATFSGIYSGWQVVENAAIALGEATRIISLPGRLCENGRPAPVAEADWAEFTQMMIDAAEVMLTAARARDREAASEATNEVADACYFCHERYRDVAGDRCVV